MNIAIAVNPKQIGAESIQTINARELHEFLGVGKDFSNWIKERIRKYEFVENQDFVSTECLSSPNLANSKSRPQKIIEYHLTLDMAKELSMVENNDRGREARRYFIECEKNLYTVLKASNFDVLGRINVRKLEQAAKLHRSVRMLARNRGLGLPEQVEQADAVILQMTGFDIPKLLGLSSSYVGKKRKTQAEQQQPAQADMRLPEPRGLKIITAINKSGIRLEVSENEMLNASTLAEYCGFASAVSINRWLVERGFQLPIVDRSGHQSYQPTNGGIEFGIVKTVPRHNSNGAAVPQLCWKAGFVEVVRKLAENVKPDHAPDFQLRH
ncbi:antA/AntB antirepressor family protein [Ferrovum sp.]|uniref:antA/AntB antirepressor family protein n=1 Tax=Ferrovum sp. TaxID=2609467 RepID=UPI00262B824F|nr:antA/AntB antirepressor family protein [Ferrovum sp.]